MRLWRGIWIGFMALVAGTAARAEWLTQGGDDPMTDKKWVASMVDFEGGPPMLVKCWDDGSLQIAIMVGRYEHGASYKELVEARFRVDKGDPFVVHLVPTEFNGILALASYYPAEPNLLTMLQQAESGKQRIVVAIGGGAFSGSLGGSTKAIQRMVSTCKLPVVGSEAREAAERLTDDKAKKKR